MRWISLALCSPVVLSFCDVALSDEATPAATDGRFTRRRAHIPLRTDRCTKIEFKFIKDNDNVVELKLPGKETVLVRWPEGAKEPRARVNPHGTTVAIEFDFDPLIDLDAGIGILNQQLPSGVSGVKDSVRSDREFLYWSEAEQACTDPRSWGLDRIDQLDPKRDECFKPVGDGARITVYVLDTGIDKRNKQFDGDNVVAFKDASIDLDDENGHGTYVAGLIAGKQTGVAPEATLVSYKLLDDDGLTNGSAIHNALCEIYERIKCSTGGSETVINLSLAGPPIPRAKWVLNELRKLGVTIVGAAGNSNGANACELFPGEYAGDKGVIIVGSTTRRDRMAWHSAAGNCVSIFAPGVATRSAGRGRRGKSFLSGTSAATAYVSGAVAAVKSAALKSDKHIDDDILEALVRSDSFVVEDPTSDLDSALPNMSSPRPLVYCGREPRSDPPKNTLRPRPSVEPPSSPSIAGSQPAPSDSGVDYFAVLAVGHTASPTAGYGLVDAALDRESRVGVGYVFPLKSPWLLTSRLDLASLEAGSEGFFESNRAELLSTVTYDLGEHSFGGSLSSTRYWTERETAFTSHRATFGYAWTPDAGGGCTPWLAGLYLSKEYADDQNGDARLVFDQGGEGWGAALRFMHERRRRGRACALTTIMARPEPTTGSYVDIWLGGSRFDADGRAWTNDRWYLSARTSFRLGEKRWYVEPSIGFYRTNYSRALSASDLAPFEPSVLTPEPLGGSPSPDIGEWAQPNRDVDGRVYTATIRRTMKLTPKYSLDLAGSVALERSDSSLSFLKQDRTIYLFTTTIRPVKMSLRRLGGQTGSGTAVVVGGGGPSGGPQPDPVTNCPSPPCS